MRFSMLSLWIIQVIFTPFAVMAAELDPPARSDEPSAAVFTVEDLFDRLESGANSVKREYGFSEPFAGPGPYGHSLNDVAENLPVVDDVEGAGPEDVPTGGAFWGVTAGAWGANAGVNSASARCHGTRSDGGRWCDNGDGTVTDMHSGLVWLQDAAWGGQYPFWASTVDAMDAHDRAATLRHGEGALMDGSKEGDWRLPTKLELEALVSGEEWVLSDNQRMFVNVRSSYYWSSTTHAYYPDSAWYALMYLAWVGADNLFTTSKAFTGYVWPVRGGQ